MSFETRRLTKSLTAECTVVKPLPVMKFLMQEESAGLRERFSTIFTQTCLSFASEASLTV